MEGIKIRLSDHFVAETLDLLLKTLQLATAKEKRKDEH
jgi:hypothetical protein